MPTITLVCVFGTVVRKKNITLDHFNNKYHIWGFGNIKNPIQIGMTECPFGIFYGVKKSTPIGPNVWTNPAPCTHFQLSL